VTNQAVVAQFGDQFTSGTLDEIYVAAAALEDVVAATNTALLGQLQGTNGATLLASILVIEARHATVLGALAGSKDLIPASGVDSTDSALTLDKYPVE
jgi:hypothetical protein